MKMERHTGFGPVVALVSGILSVIAGLLVMVYPGAAAWALTIFFPLWFIMHCISRLTHLGIIRYVAGSGYYYFSLILNIIGWCSASSCCSSRPSRSCPWALSSGPI